MSNLTLYHYTCDHAHLAIERTGILVPHRAVTFGAGMSLLWATTQTPPVAADLGLTSVLLDCDRTAHRWRIIDTRPFHRWIDTSMASTSAGRALSATGDQRLWWVSLRTADAVYDPGEDQ